jgi:hypothetical protein
MERLPWEERLGKAEGEGERGELEALKPEIV